MATRPIRSDPATESRVDANNGRALLTAREVADMLGMSVDWIYEQSRRGEIPKVTLGRYYRYRRESIEAWLRSLEG